MKTAIKVGENTLWQIGSKATNAISGLIIIGLIQRLYGETGVGIYSIVIAYVSFYFMPVDFGLNALAVKHLLDSNHKPEKVFGNILGFRLALSAALIIIALIIMQLLPYNIETQTGYPPAVKLGILLTSLMIFAQAILASANAYFQSMQRYAYSFIANMAAAIGNVGLFLVLVNAQVSIEYALISFTISGLIGAITSLLLVKRRLSKITLLLNKNYLKSLIKDTLPLTVSLILNLVYFRIDGLILPFYRSVEEVGRYNIAYKIFDTILVIPNYFANALYPVLLDQYNQGIKKFIKLVKKSAVGLTGIAVLGSAASYILAPYVVQLITGMQNPETVLYTRVLTSGLIVFFLSSIAMWSLIVIGKQKYLAYIYGTTMIINITLNVLLIPQYGALAAAYITIATEAVVFLISGPLLIKEINAKLKELK